MLLLFSGGSGSTAPVVAGKTGSTSRLLLLGVGLLRLALATVGR